jgi:hypothetical protein
MLGMRQQSCGGVLQYGFLKGHKLACWKNKETNMTFDSSVVRFAFFCSISFVQLFSVGLLDYSVYFSVLILELYSKYFNPHNNNQPAVNKHHTADSTIFELV